jgi:uncharacterized protein
MIIGRTEEIKILERAKQDPKSAFVAVYGRRRIGKTFLIRRVFEGQFSFQITGTANINRRQQLINFHAALMRQFPIMETKSVALDWFSAFQNLITGLESLDSPKKIIFLDELPWFDNAQSLFIPALEHFWNSWASARRDILLIVCASAASWMIHKLINNQGGLYNRVTHRIKLEPFTLNECEEMLHQKAGVFDRYQVIQMYMAFGGVPFYLEQIESGLNATQNIDALCFSDKGLLRIEFDNLFASLFKKADKHITVVEALAKKAKGLSRDELIRQAKLPNGGGTTKILKELEESGFIRKYRIFGQLNKNMLYQLSDFYTLFYLKFIKNISPNDKNHWINSLDNPEYRAWSGYAFEQVCLWHNENIKKALGISGVQTATSAWQGNNGTKKAQVDLVIDRRDHVINLCEMKFSIKPFTIDKKYADELRSKVGLFKELTKTQKSVFLTMITTFGLEQNLHAASLVQNALTMDILFEKYRF